MFGFKRKSQPASQDMGQTLSQDTAQNTSQTAYQESQEPQRPVDNQIPYEVYETIHEPAARRRRWAVRLVATLLAVTILIIGGTALRDKINDKPQPSQSNGIAGQMPSTQGSGQQKTNAASQQAPQSNAPLQKSDTNPVTTPQSGTVNTGTVNQPE